MKSAYAEYRLYAAPRFFFWRHYVGLQSTIQKMETGNV